MAFADNLKQLPPVSHLGGLDLLDERGALVDRGDGDARRQRPAHLVEPGGEPRRDVVAVLADQHEAEAEHDLAGAGGGDRAAPELGALDHAADVADAHRHARP